jgi:hypothetical protein
MLNNTTNKHTNDFLAALLFTSHFTNNSTNGARSKSIYDFHPDFIKAVDSFITKFEAYLERRFFEFDRLDDLHRSFGGNVYFSLSGHGCGFWDEGNDTGSELNDHLRNFSGNSYRFEHIDLSTHRGGKIDLSILVKHNDEYREKMFSLGLKE